MDHEKHGEEISVGQRIGLNLRQYRTRKGISLDALAAQTDVSKLTLIKIESGEANPTLSVIWKIAKGLGIPINALLAFETNVSIARKKDSLKLNSPDQVFVVEPLFHSQDLLELYRGFLKPKSSYFSEAHPLGVVEFVTVMAGELMMEIDGESHQLDTHDSIRFRGDRPHCYTNPASEPAVLHFVISYKNL